MLTRRSTLIFAASGALFAAGTDAKAATQQPFDQARFNAALAARRPILVVVAADWCPVCRVQGPLISRIGAEPAFANLQIFRLDFDAQKAQRRAMGASRQATIIAFRGGSEVGRSVGVTDPVQVRALMQRTIA